MINQEDLTKYEKEVSDFVGILKLRDEMLFQHINDISESMEGCINNIKSFAKDGSVGAISFPLERLKPLINSMDIALKEVEKRIIANGSDS